MTGNRRRDQKKGTPRVKPMSSGGSPMGVRQPPMLEMRKMKNTMICPRRLRQAFILITGRTMSMLAPVVPTQLDRRVPNRSRRTFTLGEPARSPSRVMLPETQNRPKRRMINVR